LFDNTRNLDADSIEVKFGPSCGLSSLKVKFSSYYASRNKILTLLYVFHASLLAKYPPGVIASEFVKNTFLAIRSKCASYLYYYFGGLFLIVKNPKRVVLESAKLEKWVDQESFVFDEESVIISQASSFLLRLRGEILN
jgi:hypothetical protein